MSVAIKLSHNDDGKIDECETLWCLVSNHSGDETTLCGNMYGNSGRNIFDEKNKIKEDRKVTCPACLFLIETCRNYLESTK